MSNKLTQLEAQLQAQLAQIDALKQQIKDVKKLEPIVPHFSGNGLIVLPKFFKKSGKDLAFYPAQWEKLFGTEQMQMIRQLIEQSKTVRHLKVKMKWRNR